jgi:hypothetical protein
MKASPSLPSLIQRALGRRGYAQQSSVRLLIVRETDPFRKGRSRYRITEPLIILRGHHAPGMDAAGTRRHGRCVA